MDCEICSDVNISFHSSTESLNFLVIFETGYMDAYNSRYALPQVREIEEVHVSDLSVEMFEELYAYSHRPLVVRNASVFWDALQVDLITHNDISIVQCKL